MLQVERCLDRFSLINYTLLRMALSSEARSLQFSSRSSFNCTCVIQYIHSFGVTSSSSDGVQQAMLGTIIYTTLCYMYSKWPQHAYLKYIMFDVPAYNNIPQY